MSESDVADESGIYDCLKTINLDGTLARMDADGLCLMEIDDFAAVEGLHWATLWPVESQALVNTAIRHAVSGKVARFSADCPTAKGTMKSWEVSVAPIRDRDGSIVALQSLSHDVTRRDRDQRETKLVSRELAHRIKNLFAMVDSLIHLSGRTRPEAQPFVVALRQRLNGLGRAISFIHPMGQEDIDDAPLTVRGLITALLTPYENAAAAVSLTGDDAEVGQDAITSIALVLNELTTNAVKYGALKDSSGRLSVNLIRSAETLTIDWRESGVVLSPEAGAAGFGTSLLDRTVRSQLLGTISRDWSGDGLAVRLQLPLTRLT